jgi:hypothetical protein
MRLLAIPSSAATREGKDAPRRKGLQQATQLHSIAPTLAPRW